MCAASQSIDFVLAKKPRSVAKFFDESAQPSVVRIVQVDADYELSAPQFAKNAHFWVFDKHRQKRVLFRAKDDCYLSIALDSPAKFHIVYRHAAGPASTLKEIFKNTRGVGDLKVALDDNPDLVLSNRSDLSNGSSYGELTALAIFEDSCLVSQAMNGSALESRLTFISTKSSIALDCVVGIRKRSSSYFRNWTDALRQQQIHPSPALLTSPAHTDIILLCGKDHDQHSSSLYIVNQVVCDSGKSPGALVAKTRLESRDRRPGDGNAASGVGLYQAGEGQKRPDMDSLRKRFEHPGQRKEGGEEEETRGGLRRAGILAHVAPSRSSSERAAATLPVHASALRQQQKSRSLSREDLFDAHQSPKSPETIVRLDQTYTRSLAGVLGIVEGAPPSRPPGPPPPPPPTLGCDRDSDDDEDGYELIRVLHGLSHPSVPANTAQNPSQNLSAKNKVLKAALSSDTQSKSKQKARLGIGLRRKKADRLVPDPPGLYERIDRASAEDHEYTCVTDPELCNPVTTKHRKWKSASEIPIDLDVASLTVDEVARCLELLKMRKYARKFKERVVDGAVLVTVTESMFIESFKMDQIDARKLVMFARENWRPSK